ncbi:hypothetical protein PIB30_051328 [Stylosanthes scabra]|uniref:BED-type domain-containing protein n=1 Tax=Stylosanthes scabra TaxID=79078 RepID=A0ABU6UGJ4_9FABA|nr:hypothetical protein [Stylosanthes scabra]
MEISDGYLPNQTQDEAEDETEETVNKKKKTTSDVWRYFKKITAGKDGIGRAQCDGCKQIFKAGGKQHGTSSLKRHLDSAPNRTSNTTVKWVSFPRGIKD